MIPYGRQSLDAKDIRAVTKTLRSAFITQGPRVREFEEAFAQYCGARYAVAVSNGTAGLHLAALAAGFGSTNDAVTTPLSFVATSNCLLYCGSRPRFADIEESFLGLDPDKARRAVGPRTRGMIKVHFGGAPCTVTAEDISNKKNFVVIEDACHALGAEIRTRTEWKKIGSGVGADLSVFSFHPVKQMTTGEGGMITTPHRDYYEKMLRLRSHGIEREAANFSNPGGGSKPWYYEMSMLGFNYRMTDFQCALGLSQLKKLPIFVSRRREVAEFYRRHLSGIEGLGLPAENPSTRSGWHLFVLRINFPMLGLTRAEAMNELRSRGVGTQVHYIPIPRQPYYRHTLNCRPQDYPVCEKYYREALSIPLYPDMTHGQVKKVVSEIKRLFRKKP